MTLEEAEYVRSRLLDTFAGGPLLVALAKVMNQPAPEVLQGMWRSPQGKEAAFRLAFQQAPLRESLRSVLVATGAEMLRQEVLGEKPSIDQEQLVWKLSEGLSSAYFSGKLTNDQVIKLGRAWLGDLLVNGPDAVAAVKDDSLLRGRLAYVFGLRYVRFGRKESAVRLFGSAQRDAKDGKGNGPKKPTDDPLHRLATAELEKLQRK
jgi:hypothetical protein